MSNILDSKDFGLKIYNRFPPKYREDDSQQQYALKRFLEAMSDGGFKYIIDEINGITYLQDPDNTDSKVLPLLFNQYGLDVFNGIPEEYLRKLLPNLGEAWSKKGSLVVIEFITSSLAGVKATTEVEYDDDGNPLIDIRLEMDSNLSDYFPDARHFSVLLDSFLPFYCDKTLIYVYVFDESANVDVNEEEYNEITCSPEDEEIKSDVDEYVLSTLKLKGVKDDVELESSETESLMSINQTFSETSYQKTTEECSNILSQTSKTNATFFTGVFGKAIFNDNTFDKHTTIVT